MRLLVKIYLAAAAACCLSLAIARADDGANDGASAPVDEKFFDQVFEGWKQLIDAYGWGYSATIDVRFPISGHTMNCDYRYHRVYCLSRSHKCFDNEIKDTVRGKNNRYCFDLTIEENGKYKLDDAQKRTPENSQPFGWFLPGCWLEFGNIPIEKLVRDSTFIITKTEDITDPHSGEKIKEVEFEADFVDPEVEQERIYRGRILFLPDSYWLIKEYTVFSDSLLSESERFVVNGNVSYQTVDGLPFAEKSEENICYKDDPDKPLLTAICQISEVHRWEPVKEECFLKYYGLRKPMLVTPKELLRRALILAAVVLLGLGLFIKFRKPRSGENRSAEDSLSQTESNV